MIQAIISNQIKDINSLLVIPSSLGGCAIKLSCFKIVLMAFRNTHYLIDSKGTNIIQSISAEAVEVSIIGKNDEEIARAGQARSMEDPRESRQAPTIRHSKTRGRQRTTCKDFTANAPNSIKTLTMKIKIRGMMITTYRI